MNKPWPEGSRVRSAGNSLIHLPAMAGLLLAAGMSPGADSFQPTGAMHEARRGHVAVRLGDSQVLVAGGSGQAGVLSGTEVYDAATGQWTVRGPMATARTGHTAAPLPDGRVLVAGGEDGNGNALASAEIFNPATGTWVAAEPMATARRQHTANVAPDGTIVVVGGNAGTGDESLKSCERYSPASGTWSVIQSLHAGRRMHTATFQGSRLILAGGLDGTDYNPAIELLAPEDGSWNVISSAMPPARAQIHHTMTLMNDQRMVIAGGSRGGPQRSAAFIMPTWLWANAAQMSSARAEHAATLLTDERLLVTGGVSDSGSVIPDAEVLRTTGSWAAAGALGTARAGHTATLLSRGRVLITGGYNADGPLASSEIFTPVAPVWEEATPMKSARLYHTATLLSDGSVLAAGGTNGPGFTLAGSAERYFPDTGKWTSTGAAPARHSHRATLLPDGRLLVSGGMVDAGLGNPATGVLSRTDIYDPATNAWTQVADMQTARASHFAVLLPDGRVLAAGGVSTMDGKANSTSEIYNPHTDQWESAGSLPDGPAFTTGALLTDGRVIAIAGRDYWDESPAIAARYNPATGEWTSGGTMTSAHFHPACTPLPDGRVLVASSHAEKSRGNAEIYDPAANSWAPAAAMTSPAFAPDAVLLTSGTVLLTGERDDPGLSNSRFEVYDPAAGIWTALTSTYTHGAVPVLLADGRVMLTSGSRHLAPATPKCLVYNPYATAAGNARPVIDSAVMDESGRLVVTGSGFGSAPVVRWQRLGDGFTLDLSAAPGTLPGDTSFTSAPLAGFPSAYGMITVLADGIPSASVIVPPVVPDIAVALAAPLGHGNTIEFDNAVPGSSSSLTFTVRNGGSFPLANLAVSIDGPDAAQFEVTGPSADGVAPSQSATFTVRFAPDGIGLKSAVLHVVSSDPDEPALAWPIKGTASITAVTLNALSAVTIDEDGETGAVPVVLAGAADPAAFRFTAVSGNPALVSPAGIAFSGAGANRTVTVTPSPGAWGSATIMIVATSSGHRATTFLNLIVNAVEDPPTLAEISGPLEMRESEPVRVVSFTGISAGPGESQVLTVTAQSSNPGLIPHPAVTYVSLGAGGSVSCVPATGQSGVAEITVTVSDGQASVSRSFAVRVVPQIRCEPASVPEGNSGTVLLPFRIFIGSPQPGPVSVNYSVAGGTATAGSDFTSASGTAVIPAGATETTVEVAVAGDTAFEGDETLELTLSRASGGFLGTEVFTGTIVDDDSEPSLQLNGGTITEGPGSTPGAITLMWISAGLPAPAPVELTWTVATRDGSALAGSDYNALSGKELRFFPGETQKWITIAVPAPAAGEAESDEEFYLDVQRPGDPPVTITCTIRRLSVHEIIPVGAGVYAMRFPTGVGQSYLIEELNLSGSQWLPVSTLLTGTGSIVTQVVYSEKPSALFRVVASPLPQGVSDVGP